MPTITRKSSLVDRNGRAMSYALYQTPRHNPKAYKPRMWLSNDTPQNVTSYDRMELVNYSRQLFAQVDIVNTAVRQKNNWAFGDAWDAHYVGLNVDWALEAREFLENQFYPFGNRRGPQFDLRTSLKLMGQAWDVDGDDLMVLTESESHFPQYAMFPATRVGTYGDRRGQRGGDEVKGGPFDGAKIIDGVILNRDNKCVGVRVLNDDGTNTDISTFNADLSFEADWVDQIRGLPMLSPSLLRWIDLQDIDGHIRAGVKRATGIALKIKNAEGEAPVGNEVITEDDSPAAGDTNNTVTGGSASDRKIHYEEIAGGGEAYYLDAAQNEEIDQLTYSNPHPNVEAFIERIQRGALQSIGWYYELINLGEGGRAASRQLCDLANQTITNRQATGRRRWRRLIGYALAKAAKHGFISKPKDPRDYNLWEPGYPKHLSVDAGNDVKASLDLIKMGLSTIGIEAAKAGYHPDFIRQQQKKELNNAVEDAKALFAQVKAQGMTFQECLQLVRQTNPNPGNSQPLPDTATLTKD